MNSALLVLPLLIAVSLPVSVSPLGAASSSSGPSSLSETISETLEKNFKVDTSSYESDDFVSFGCLWDRKSSHLKYYCYYPSDYFDTCDPDTVNYLASLKADSRVVFDREYSTSIYSVSLSYSLDYTENSGYIDSFSDYRLVSPESEGLFYSYVVDGFSGYHQGTLNRLCVNAVKYDYDYAWHVHYSVRIPGIDDIDFDSAEDFTQAQRLTRFDTNSETQFIDDGSTVKLVGSYDKINVITSKTVGFYSKYIDSFGSDSSGGRMLQNYFCAFDTDLPIADLTKVQLCYHSRRMYGKTRIQINSADSIINADWDKYLSDFRGSSSFDAVDSGSGALSYHNVTVSKGTRTYKKQTSVWGELFNFGSVTYSYDTIYRPSSDAGITGSASGYDWCFRFMQNKYDVNLGRFSKDTNAANMYFSGNGYVYLEDGDEGQVTYDGDSYDNSCFMDVEGVQILKLWDNTSTGLVEYSVSDSPSDTSAAEGDSDDHSGDVPHSGNSFWDGFMSWLTGNMPGSIIVCVVGAVVGIALLSFMLPLLFKLLFLAVKYILIGLWWVVKAPFLLIRFIVSSIGGGK